MMNNRIFQKIYDELERYFVGDWSKIVAYFEYGEDSYSFSFFENLGNKYVKCYDLEGVSEKELEKTFAKLDRLFVKERTKENNRWSNMTMVVDREGNMHTDFDYTDLSEGNYKYKKEWKSKYLK